SEPAHGRGVARTLVGRVPYFVWGFVAVAIAGALGAFSPVERAQLGHITRYAFFIALVGVGFRTRLDVVRRIGVRPVVIGVGLWAVAAGAVLLWIVL
ncbi:MAG: putative sulfate exporter family transporter, partial [Planctomycetes bacterium]|nr:putative sulfate exporter family transporter [Planctomycetota bacterium]